MCTEAEVREKRFANLGLSPFVESPMTPRADCGLADVAYERMVLGCGTAGVFG